LQVSALSDLLLPVARMLDLYRLRTDDPELLRAQFRAFVRNLPLLYFMLACNAMAVVVAYAPFAHPRWCDLFAGFLVLVAGMRGVWWWRRRGVVFTDAQIRRHIRNTNALAGFMAMAFMVWALQLYPYGDAYARGHLVLFLALTQLGSVAGLMPVRSAALAVATVAMVPFTAYFLFADGGRMAVDAINFGLVGSAILVLFHVQNEAFAALVQSRRDLHLRQLETQKLSDDNRRIAFTDALSGLPNRRALIARLEDVREGEVAMPDRLAVIFIDLDGFKDINDNYGHEFGDALIRRMGERLRSVCAPGVMLARMGGDEFAVLIAREGAEAFARATADRILSTLTVPLDIAGKACHVGASIGLACDADGTASPSELLRRADTAMYRVKAEGKGGVLGYDPSFDADRLRRQSIEREIRAGLERGEFSVVYQPLVDAVSGAMVGVEALLRWPGRPGGPLGPDDFIDIAEASGLIQPLGQFVLRRACEEMAGLAPLSLSVNISPAQFRYPGFERGVADVLVDTGFDPARLQIEITEGYLIDNPARAARAIDAFREMGVGVALDDFGTGFASIGYLQAYGFTCIKIDKTLCANLGGDPRTGMLISGLVFMAKGLDLKVVAEGVETEAQAALLRLAGCHTLQGYLFGRPAPLADLAPWRGRAGQGWQVPGS